MSAREKRKARREAAIAEWKKARAAELAPEPTAPPVPEIVPEPEVVPEPEDCAECEEEATDLAESYPEGANVGVVVEWIGDDSARADFAVAVEMASDKPRKGVLSHAQEVLGA